MNQDKKNIGLPTRLLASEDWNSPLRDQYEAEVKALLIRKLTPMRRNSLIFVSVAMVGFSVLTAYLAATASELPTIIRLMFVEGTIFQLAAAVYCIYVLKSGVFHAKRHPLFISGMMWCFSVFLGVHFMMIMPQVHLKIAVLFSCITLVTMISAGVQLLRTCIEQSELNTHERLLETVLRLMPERDAE